MMMRYSIKTIIEIFAIMVVGIAALFVVVTLLSGCGGSKIELLDGKPVLVFADGASTPSVIAGGNFATSNGKATIITDFKHGKNKKVITILFNDDNTTILSNDNISLIGGFSLDALKGDGLTLVRLDGVWKEANRVLK